MIGVDQPVLDIDHLCGWIGREDVCSGTSSG
jgi:hypothetical protein